jgi:hypothetical protein
MCLAGTAPGQEDRVDGEGLWITDDLRRLRRPYEADSQYTRLKHRVAFEFTGPSDFAEEVGMVAIRLFGAINEHADVVLDLDRPEGDRARALHKLRRALRPLTLQGRPPGTTHGVQGTTIVEQLRTVALNLFGKMNTWADAALADDQPEEDRKAALSRLRRALRCLVPRGRPYEITDMDVAWDARSIDQMHREFVRLMTALEAGELGADAAANAVEYIRKARRGDQDSIEQVQQHAPVFLGAPLGLSRPEVEGLLDRLKGIRRPSSWRTFVIGVLVAKYDVRPAAAATVVRRMMDSES